VAARRGHGFRLIPGSDRVHLAFRLTGVLEALGVSPEEVGSLVEASDWGLVAEG
jgi:hypothetical protein